MRFVAIAAKYAFFIVVGMSIANVLILYFSQWFFPPPYTTPMSIGLGIIVGVVVGSLPWGKSLWKAIALGVYLLIVHGTGAWFANAHYHSYNLYTLGFTEVLNFQAAYFFFAYVIAFFLFDPLHWFFNRPKRRRDRA